MLVVGYSIGELVVYVIVGSFDVIICFVLVVQCVQLMDGVSFVDVGLQVVFGLECYVLQLLCDLYGVYMVIVNGQDYFIVGGMYVLLLWLVDVVQVQGVDICLLLVYVFVYILLLVVVVVLFVVVFDVLLLQVLCLLLLVGIDV